MFEPRQNILADVRVDIRKYVVSWLKHSCEINRPVHGLNQNQGSRWLTQKNKRFREMLLANDETISPDLVSTRESDHIIMGGVGKFESRVFASAIVTQTSSTPSNDRRANHCGYYVVLTSQLAPALAYIPILRDLIWRLLSPDYLVFPQARKLIRISRWPSSLWMLIGPSPHHCHVANIKPVWCNGRA